MYRCKYGTAYHVVRQEEGGGGGRMNCLGSERGWASIYAAAGITCALLLSTRLRAALRRRLYAAWRRRLARPSAIVNALKISWLSARTYPLSPSLHYATTSWTAAWRRWRDEGSGTRAFILAFVTGLRRRTKQRYATAVRRERAATARQRTVVATRQKRRAAPG